MDNNKDRQFYWEVKDFMNKKANPQPSNSSKPKITDAVKNVLEQNNPYTQKSFNNKSEYIPVAQKAIKSISAAEKGYRQNCKALTRNDISNPFLINEGWFDAPTAGDFQDKQKEEEEQKKQMNGATGAEENSGMFKGIVDTVQDVGDWVSIGTSFIPVVGQGISIGIDSASSLVDVAQGDYGDAAFRAGSAALSAIPVGGGLAKLGLKTGKGLATGADVVSGVSKLVGRGVGEAGEAALKTGAKEVAGEAGEAALKTGAKEVAGEAGEAAAKGVLKAGTKQGLETSTHWMLKHSDDIVKGGAKVGKEGLEAAGKEGLEAAGKGALKAGGKTTSRLAKLIKGTGKAIVAGISGEAGAQRLNSGKLRQMSGEGQMANRPRTSGFNIGQFSSAGKIA